MSLECQYRALEICMDVNVRTHSPLNSALEQAVTV